MRRILVLLCVGALLTGCTTGPPKLGVDPIAVSAKVEKAAERLDAVAAFAELFLPFASTETQATIRAGVRAARTALAAARIAGNAAAQIAELERTRSETERIAGAVGLPPDS